MKKHILQSILVALALTTATLAAQAQDTPKTLTELQTRLASSTSLSGDVAVERLATLSAAAGTLSDTDFKTIDAAIVAKMLTRGYDTWSTDQANVTINADKVVVISGSINVSGTITVNSGKTLVVLPAETGGSITSTGNNSKTSLFTTKGGTIVLKGRSADNQLVIDGGTTTTSSDPKTYLTDNYNTYYNAGTSGNKAVLVYMDNQGSLRSTFAKFQNNWRYQRCMISSSRYLDEGNGLCFYGNKTDKFKTCGFYGCTFSNLWNIGTNMRGTGVGTNTALFDTDFNITSVESGFTLGGLLFNKCYFNNNVSIICDKSNGTSKESLGRYSWMCSGGGALGCESAGKEYNLLLNNCEFKNNWSGWFGGAVFWNNTSALFVKGCTFDGNTSGMGGAIYVEGKCTITNSTFENNEAKQINHSTYAYQSGNGFDGCGGAIYARCCNTGYAGALCQLELKGKNTFSENTADLDGGAMEIYLDKTGSLTTFKYDIRLNASGDDKPVFSSNTAKRCGGGIAVVESPELFGNETAYTIDANIAFNAGEVSDNTAAGTNGNTNSNCRFNEPGDGGGVYAEYMNLTIGDGFTIKDNIAANNGGGIFSRGIISGSKTYGAITVGDATVVGNQTKGNVSTSIASNIKDGSHTGAAYGTYGTQQGNGGAICVSGGSFTMTGGTLGSSTNPNKAKGNGGCVFVTDGATVTLSGGTVSYNETELNGGGFFVNNGTTTLSGGSILNNTATKNGGGVYAENKGTVTLSGGDVSNNTALNGGGIYLNSAAHMTMSDGILSNNTAVGKEFTTLGLTTANGNTSTNEGVGGGIYLAPGTGTSDANRTMLTFNVTGTIGIYNNEATNAADDVFADKTNTCVVIPEVQFMNLKGLTRVADGWYEDYAKGDTDYDDGFKMKTSGDVLRFRYAIANDKNIWKVIVTDGSGTTKITNKYVALTMGVSNGELVINASGLKPGESILVTIERPMQNGDNPSNYASNKDKTNYTVTLTGDADGKATVKMANLMVGWYELKRSPWAWAYSDEGEYKATTSTATSGDDIAKHLDGKAGSTTINKDIGSTATDGILAADVNYKSTTYGFFKVEPIEPLPLNGEATINNKFVTTTP